jgi:hypothetical protein
VAICGFAGPVFFLVVFTFAICGTNFICKLKFSADPQQNYKKFHPLFPTYAEKFADLRLEDWKTKKFANLRFADQS